MRSFDNKSQIQNIGILRACMTQGNRRYAQSPFGKGNGMHKLRFYTDRAVHFRCQPRYCVDHLRTGIDGHMRPLQHKTRNEPSIEMIFMMMGNEHHIDTFIRRPATNNRLCHIQWNTCIWTLFTIIQGIYQDAVSIYQDMQAHIG
ncbi:hypothetical protein Bwad004_03480 [Bilophila wadsworthia]